MDASWPIVFISITLMACLGTGCQRTRSTQQPPQIAMVAEQLQERAKATPRPHGRAAPQQPDGRSPLDAGDAPPSSAGSRIPMEGEETVPLEIEIRGLRGKGKVFVAVFESPLGFPEHERAAQRLSKVPTSDQITISFEGVSTNTVSVAAFQDAVEDGKLTKGAFGIPREPYGFSNNVRGRFGPPTFAAAAFHLADQTHPVKIFLK